MNELKPSIHDEANGLDYVLAGDYYIPAIELPEDDDRPIGKWGRMHQAYLAETNPLLLNHLILTEEGCIPTLPNSMSRHKTATGLSSGRWPPPRV